MQKQPYPVDSSLADNDSHLGDLFTVLASKAEIRPPGLELCPLEFLQIQQQVYAFFLLQQSFYISYQGFVVLLLDGADRLVAEYSLSSYSVFRTL